MKDTSRYTEIKLLKANDKNFRAAREGEDSGPSGMGQRDRCRLPYRDSTRQHRLDAFQIHKGRLLAIQNSILRENIFHK